MSPGFYRGRFSHESGNAYNDRAMAMTRISRWRQSPILIPLAILMTAGTNPPDQNSAAASLPGQDSIQEQQSAKPGESGQVPAPDRQADARLLARHKMVDDQMVARDIVNPRVLDVMRKVPRHEFVPPPMRPFAYEDSPLGIGHSQTISQPYIVALMTQLADPRPGDKALDIGTGSGYQAAVLAELVQQVYSIEIVEPLAHQAAERLQQLGYTNIEVRHGDGYRGWPEQAPFDLIMVAAAPDHIPPALVEQLAAGGKLVIPVGDHWQRLMLVEKAEDGTVTQRKIAPVAFVPMTGEADKQENR